MSMKRTVLGVGYKGYGNNPMYIGNSSTTEYRCWYNMMNRCYSEKQKAITPTYQESLVDESWHNFQNFANWYKGYKRKEKGYQLDKDLLVKGNKVYSPENCCLIPSEVNKLIVVSKRSSAMLGTWFDESRGLWRSSLSKNSKVVTIGWFETELEAHLEYVKQKEIYVRKSAKKWKGVLDDRVFQALTEWTVY